MWATACRPCWRARQFPAVRLDATVDTYLALRDQIDAGLLDLAVTLSLDEDPASPLLRRTRFVWAAGRVDVATHAPLPRRAETLSAPGGGDTRAGRGGA